MYSKYYLIITSLLLVSASARCSHTSGLNPPPSYDCTILTLAQGNQEPS